MKILESLEYLTVLKSPFKGLKLQFYFGDAIYGTPYNIKWGIHYCPLGYSIKWPDDFLRYDFPPRLAITLFGKQFVIDIVPNTAINCEREYWDAWWNYRNKTDKNASTPVRLNQLFEKLSLTWLRLSGKNEDKIEVDYYPYVLKTKYVFPYLILDKLKEVNSKVKTII